MLEPNPDTLACLFRRSGYQTGITGKAHMVNKWNDDGFEFQSFTDMMDSHPSDPTTCHYFKYLCDLGLDDHYEEGTPKPGQGATTCGAVPASLPYEHSIERFTGNESLRFLQERDTSRPFFLQMSFQRPHDPITPAAEHFDRYDPDALTLPDNAHDWLERQFAGKPDHIRERLLGGSRYPLAADETTLRRALASYYALISCIDDEIGRVLDHLEAVGELDNTVVLYTSDHGDFAGEHGLHFKNLGIYESIHRIPFLLSWPTGPCGEVCDGIIESVDWYPTVCELCDITPPTGRDGQSVVPIARGEAPGKDAAFCEWNTCSAIRTRDHRLVFYRNHDAGELYDHTTDPGETVNLWDDPAARATRLALTDQLLRFTLGYRRKLGLRHQVRHMPSRVVQFGRVYWRDLKKTYDTPGQWPPPER